MVHQETVQRGSYALKMATVEVRSILQPLESKENIRIIEMSKIYVTGNPT